MREELLAHLVDAGWRHEPGTDSFHGPNGERAHYDADGAGLPARNVLILTLPDRDIGFAIGLCHYDLAGYIRLVVHLRQAVAGGAVRAWLDRVRHRGPVWIVPGGQRHWRDTRTGTRQPPFGDEAEALLANLVEDPPAAAVAAAARMAETLAAAGWRDTTTRSTKAVAGQCMLYTATLRTPHGVHRLSYVLTGDPHMPEALRWRSELSNVYSRLARWGMLIDTTGIADPPLPIDDQGDRLADVLTLLLRDIPAMTTRRHWETTGFAINSVTSVMDGSTRPDPRVFLATGLTPRPGPSLAEALQSVHNDPDGESWLWLGFTAAGADRRHLAVTAFGRAAELGVGGGLPLLWRGWLTRYTDPRSAADDLGRAAALGGVTGEAFTKQARVLGEILADPEAALEAGAQAVAKDPDYISGWEWHGLTLAKHGRAEQAVEVLTEALRRRETFSLWYFLGYAKALCGETAAALDCLETAVRIAPRAASMIIEDPDLAMLRSEPRFHGLSDLVERETAAAERERESVQDLAADERDALHRRVRESMRPDDPGDDPGDPLDRLRAAYAVRDVRAKRFEAADLPEELSHPDLHELLCGDGLGLPYEINDFSGACHDRVRRYVETADDRLPLGLGDGMFRLGDLGDGVQVAVEGLTGAVYLLRGGQLSYASPALERFLLHKCLAADEHAWRITPDTVDKLDAAAGIRDGGLGILAENLDAPTRDRLAEFVSAHGSLLHTLLVREGERGGVGLSAMDFAAHCPNLRRLELHDSRFDESVFTHPVLTRLKIHQSVYCGSNRDIRLDAGSALEFLNLDDTTVDSDSFHVGPDSPLRVFTAGLDQDFGAEFPARLVFDQVPHLWGIQVHCGLAHWHLELRGRLPELYKVDQDGLEHGGYTYSVTDAAPEDRKRYFSLIRAGKGFISRMQ